MSRKMLRVLAVLSLVTLPTATVHAAGRSLAAAGEPGLASAWEWITGWFHGETGLSAVWGEEGSSMDPNGLKTEGGAGMDPDGLRADEGPGMDPNG